MPTWSRDVHPSIPQMARDISQMSRQEAMASLRRDHVRMNAIHGLQYKGAHYGGFHAKVVGTTLRITVKIFWEWLHTKAGRPDKGGPWDPAIKLKYQTDSEKSIPLLWSHKWKFRHPVSQLELTPEIILESVANKSDANITFRVHNIHSGAGLIPAEQTVDLYKNDASMVDEWDKIKKESSGTAVMMNEWERFEATLKRIYSGATSAQVGLTRNGNTWVVNTPDLLLLARLWRALRGEGAKGAKPPLVISASSGNAQKARNMADAVDRAFNTLGAGPDRYPTKINIVTTKAKWQPFTAHKQQGTAAIAISAFNSAEYQKSRQDWFYRYKVVDHEFGHCLTLPDEYLPDYGGSIGKASHVAWQNLCALAGVTPNTVSDGPKGKNRSIMSCGWVTYPCHYVTLWDALKILTGDSTWTIVRGTETDI